MSDQYDPIRAWGDWYTSGGTRRMVASAQPVAKKAAAPSQVTRTKAREADEHAIEAEAEKEADRPRG